MKPITQADIDKHMELERKIDERVGEVFYQVQRIKTGKDPKGAITNIEYDDKNGRVNITTTEESHCSCCPDEHYYYDFPIVYLFHDDWQEPLKEEVRLKQEEAQKFEDMHKKEFEEKRDAEEFERYQRLKKECECEL